MDLIYSDLKSHMSTQHTVLSGKWTCTDNIGFRVLMSLLSGDRSRRFLNMNVIVLVMLLLAEAYMDLYGLIPIL